MFAYTALFVGSVIVALIVLRLFNAVLNAGRGAYRAMLPGSKHSVFDKNDDVSYSSRINDAGRRKHSFKRKGAGLRAAGKPWGW